jgi:hypothetical protein
MCDPKPCEACDPKLGTPTPLDQMRFDYAWKWFEFHAEQRTKMFNYMLIGMGIFATAFVTAVDKKLALEAAVLSSAAVLVALVFAFIDHRNRHLYVVAMDVLIDDEKRLVFAGRTDAAKQPTDFFPDPKGQDKLYGVSGRVAREDLPDDVQQRLRQKEPVQLVPDTYRESLRRHLYGMRRGQHRYWMPFVGFSFATLFLGAATRAWLVYTQAVPFPWVLGEGVVLILIGLGAMRAQIKKPAHAGVWPFGAILVGLAFVGVASKPSLRTPFLSGSAIEIAIGADLNNVLDLHLTQPLPGTPDAPLGTLVSAQFGPFGSEPGKEVVFDCTSGENAAAVANVRKAMSDARDRHQRVAALLVGSVDKTQMKPKAQNQFASDAGLARARVAKVEDCLWPKGGAIEPPEVLRVFSGPAYTPAVKEGASAAAQGRQDDRVVRVLVLGL